MWHVQPKASFLATTTHISMPRKRKHGRNRVYVHTLAATPKRHANRSPNYSRARLTYDPLIGLAGNLQHPTGTGGKGKVISNLSLAPPCSLMSLHSQPNETKCYL
ncbi:hypothetical protein CDAR_368301 [Caerostris darwini]|uniref:Ribosomal protein L2 n=1 Tax=Caerostris darwini TaxID=1538125 RepID=A0AAV4WDM6_9ARAC|nr:hypothetical protein CDAR_368301 [Caerostris darwini]